jgi:hypothetical protein
MKYLLEFRKCFENEEIHIQVGISKNACQISFVGLKRKKQAALVDFKRKIQECHQVNYSYHETKLFGVN